MKIKALVTLGYYDGPVEFVGQVTKEDEEFPDTVLGWYQDDADDHSRIYEVWECYIEKGVDERRMRHLGLFNENDIDWSESSF
jgi:hypothetical protein